MLQFVAVCCSLLQLLQYVAVCHSVLLCGALCYTVFHGVAVFCSVSQVVACVAVPQVWAYRCVGHRHSNTPPSHVLQSVAVCCSLLQCVAECFSVLQSVSVCCRVFQCVAECFSVLQSVSVCCRAFQCVAECFSVLQCGRMGYLTFAHSLSHVL